MEEYWIYIFSVQIQQNNCPKYAGIFWKMFHILENPPKYAVQNMDFTFCAMGTYDQRPLSAECFIKLKLS